MSLHPVTLAFLAFLQFLIPNSVFGGGCCLGSSGRDCHPTPGATEPQCVAKGCLWCPLPPGAPGPWCTYPDEHVAKAVKVDCYPKSDATPQKCRSRGCLWCEPGDQDRNQPWCIFDSSGPNIAGYNVQNLNEDSGGISASLSRRSGSSITGSPIHNLNLKIKYESASHLHVTMTPSSANEEPASSEDGNTQLDSMQYSVQIQHSPFGIVVKRSSTKTVIFDTRNIPGPIIETQYLAINTLVPSRNIYGFGEQLHPNLRHHLNWNKLPMFSRDQPVYSSNFNMYGVHPFYMVVENDGNAHGVVFINSHAQRATLKPYPAVQYETIGGNLEFRIFLGPTPDQVVQQYLNSIGLPMLPPYWSLGFHLCRYGYTSLDNVKQVHDRMVKSGIPYDTQWVDIDYMDGFKDFTYDRKKWNGLPEFAKQLHKEHRHFVTIVDPAIKSRTSNYPPLDHGLQANVFFKQSGQHFEGSVWPGCSYFPDFSCSRTKEWWSHWISNWHSTVESDGLWIDMNEPSNAFCPAVSDANIPYCGHCASCAPNKWNKPPVVRKGGFTRRETVSPPRTSQMSLETVSRCANPPALTTVSPGKRPFILSRSTTVGSGQYAFHWTGDNFSQWKQMQYSITTIIEFQWFGIPFTGADICGFNDATNEELCLRWTQLGAFYPFMRNHNAISMPVASRSWSLAKTNTKVYERRNVDKIHLASPSVYPFVPGLNHRGHSNQTAVLQVLNHFSSTKTIRYPEGEGCLEKTSSGQTRTLNIPFSTIGLFIYGGNIIPWQQPSTTTYESRKNPFGLTVALDDNHRADGDLMWDNGESTGNHNLLFHMNATVSRTRSSGILSIYRLRNNYRGADSLQWDTVTLYGIFGEPSRVTVNGSPFGGAKNYDPNCNTLKLTGLGIPFSSGPRTVQTVEWFYK